MVLFLLVAEIIPYFAGCEQELPFKQTKMKSKYLSLRDRSREFVLASLHDGQSAVFDSLPDFRLSHIMSTKF
ncbi:MAG: hypothetical protein H5U11_16550 [Rhizobium sp.]|nr:hypothetical protein [Rhizobium sp.]